MQLDTCPVCHSTIDLLSIVEDDASRQLLIELAKIEPWLASPVLLYISLFKPAKSKLNNSRALKLLKETLNLTEDHKLLAHACDLTVQAIRERRQQGTAQPLKKHSYLIKVIENTVYAQQAPQTVIPASRTNRSSSQELFDDPTANLDELEQLLQSDSNSSVL